MAGEPVERRLRARAEELRADVLSAARAAQEPAERATLVAAAVHLERVIFSLLAYEEARDA